MKVVIIIKSVYREVCDIVLVLKVNVLYDSVSLSCTYGESKLNVILHHTKQIKTYYVDKSNLGGLIA